MMCVLFRKQSKNVNHFTQLPTEKARKTDDEMFKNLKYP